jgi:hypothetical protein
MEIESANTSSSCAATEPQFGGAARELRSASTEL